MVPSPLVFILDIDGTIIGDISPQVMVWDMVQAIKHNGGKVRMDIKDLTYKLSSTGIVRPHFKEFIQGVKAANPTAEFFIYTASQTKWAEFLIKNLEKAFNVKFNRPIFTRKDCHYENGELRKNLNRIKTKVYTTVKKRYPGLSKEAVMSNCLIVDNSKVFSASSDNKKMVHCSTYNYKFPENIPSIIDRLTYEKFYKYVHEMLLRYGYNVPVTSSYYKFQRAFYSAYVKDLERCDKPADKFWLLLKELIVRKNIKTFDEATVKYLNKKVYKVCWETTSTA